MSALALFASAAVHPRFWFTSETGVQTESTTADKAVQTDPCGFQSIGYTVLRRCPHPQIIWDYIDAVPCVVDCGVPLLPPMPNTSWIPSFKPMPNSP